MLHKRQCGGGSQARQVAPAAVLSEVWFAICQEHWSTSSLRALMGSPVGLDACSGESDLRLMFDFHSER